MWKQIVANKRLIITAAIALVAGCALGVLVGLAVRNTEPESEQTGRIGVQSVLPATRMERLIAFEKCGHTERVDLKNEAFIGYTRQELQAFYENCEITAFSGERVVLRQTFAGCCPKHVLLRTATDGTVHVLQTDPEFYIEQLLRVLPAEAYADMDAQEKKRLSDGVLLDTIAEVDAYFESMES